MLDGDLLLSGPRGRRLLIEIAYEVERARRSDAGDLPLWSAMFSASYRASADRGNAVALFGPGAEAERARTVTAEQVAERLFEVPDPTIGSDLLRRALARSVDAAAYWQHPGGEDVVCADPSMIRELTRFAERVAVSPEAQWWAGEAALGDQWVHAWNSRTVEPPIRSATSILVEWRARVVEGERRAAADRPADPDANWSGAWWSRPPFELLSSARRLPSGTPAGLCFVEDRMGWTSAAARELVVPAGLRIAEIGSAGDWAELCRRHPIEVTAEKRHDWYRATGRVGRWVLPDWQSVAEDHDAVHLSVAGYLAAAGTVIDVGDGTASVIAGWDPDATYWFTDEVRLRGTERTWLIDDQGEAEPTESASAAR